MRALVATSKTRKQGRVCAEAATRGGGAGRGWMRLAAAALLVAVPVGVQAGAFVPPKGCTAYLTVQSRGCEVAHFWTCEGDPEGQHWTVALDDRGPHYLTLVDREFRWLRSYPLRLGTEEKLVTPEKDPASFSRLLAEGSDSYDFQVDVSRDGTPLRRDTVVGFDHLTGATRIIDGEPLLVTKFAFSITNDQNSEVFRVSGQQFVSKRFNTFFGGIETATGGGSANQSDHSPVQLIEPGEAGFLADRPIYDCGTVMSGLDRSRPAPVALGAGPIAPLGAVANKETKDEF